MKCSPSKARHGLTLIEVVVGLTLMATILVASLLAFASHRRQRRIAEAKLDAVALADDLMNQFLNRREGIPESARGAIQGRPGWIWQTHVVGITAPAQVPMRVIRLELVDTADRELRQPLVILDVVKAIPQTESVDG